jgi:hypothetical protein
VSAESIGKTHFWGLHGRETLTDPSRRGWRPTVDQNWAKILPREAVWSMSGVEMEKQNGNSG